MSALPITGFHHGGVSVPDLTRAIAWYGDILGFEVEARFAIPSARAEVAMIVRDGLRMELFQVDGARPLPEDRRHPASDLKTHGNKHIAFSIQDLDAFVTQAATLSTDIALVVRESFGRSCFLRDCAGNLIEFVETGTQCRG